MTKAKVQQLFELAQELYIEELKKSGASTIPYAYAENEADGSFLAFSWFGEHSKVVKAKLEEIKS